MPTPGKEHAWLQQFVGEWDAEAQCFMNPDGPPAINRGVEKIRSIGGFWIVAEMTSDMGGQPFSFLQTLGFDPLSGKFVGTWVDSMTGYLWKYVGTLDEARTTLSFDTEGPCPMAKPGELKKFREVIQRISADEKVYTSSILSDDGEWILCLEARAHRRI